MPTPTPIARHTITEDAIALRLAQREAGRLRYCHAARAWFVWDGVVWRRDRAGRAVQAVREASREAVRAAFGESKGGSEDSSGRSWGRMGPGSQRFAIGVERLAHSDPALAVTAADWDGDPLVLGTPGGTLKLETGKMTEADPADGISRTTAVAPGELATVPLWLARLTAQAGLSAGAARFLQQALGAATSGLGEERIITFLHDPQGAAGEALMTMAAGLLGDYARQTSLARLAGADPASLLGLRLVLACERGPSRPWPRALGELFTEPDRIAHGDRSVLPSAKLFVVGAQPPDTSQLHPAARRRVLVVPVDGPVALPDPEFDGALAAERPAILRWMLYGFADWRQNGYVLSPSVLEATARALETRDAVSQFLQDACRCAPGDSHFMVAAGPLFCAWTLWAQTSGERAGSPRTFADALEARGFRRARRASGRYYCGIELNEEYNVVPG